MLFSQHYLETRLPQHAEWADDPAPAFEALRALWDKAQQFGGTWSEAQTEDEFIKPALTALGWAFIVQPKSKQAGRVTRPDYALFADETTQQDAYPHQGDDDAFYSRALAIAEAKFWGRPLSQKESSGRESWKTGENPSHQMVSYLVGTRAPWGILTNGRIWRLYSREVSSTASEFYEVDLGRIMGQESANGESANGESANGESANGESANGESANGESANLHSSILDSFRRFWLFFRRDAFIADAQGKCFVQRVHEGSATYAREISDKLKELVYTEVMPEIAAGFIAYRRERMNVHEETEESLRGVYSASLSLLYKLLFLLYAEARGLLPVDNPGYREQSLTALAQWAADRRDRSLPLSTATHATPRYEALLALFRRIDQGDPSLGVPRYDGGLFNPQNPDNAFLEQHRLSDRAVACAVDVLVRDAGQPVDYAYISVRNLGAIYEGLLENKLRITNGELRMANSESASPSPSPLLPTPYSVLPTPYSIQLVNDKGERKATGSYYTPDYIVEYIVQQTLGPVLEARAETFAAGMARVADVRRALERTADPGKVRLLRNQLDVAERDVREAFLGIKVLDPAMGSGHFLVNAVDFLTDGIIRQMQTYHDAHPGIPWAWNPIQQLVERVRAEILDEMARQGIALDPTRLDDTALLTRLVMKRCIYGVDLNKMAVELAKLSLWLHSFTVGAPLSFLDHHLRWGNSLIGTDVRTVEAGIQQTETGQFGLFAGPFAGLLELTALMVEVVDRADATLSDVQRSAGDFAALQGALTPYKQALDLWVSRHFGNAGADEFLRLYGDAVLPALRGEKQVAGRYKAAIARAHELWEEKRFFHWDLEFPEVFVDLRKRDWAENPGFDAVIGNPPYFSISELSQTDREYLKVDYTGIFSGNSDILYYFLSLSDKLLMREGWFGVIVARYFQEAKYAQSLRAWLASRLQLRALVDFKNFQVFGRDVSVLASIVILYRVRPNTQATTSVVRIRNDQAAPAQVAQGLLQQESALFERFIASPPSLAGAAWQFSSLATNSVHIKLEDCSIPLGEITQIVQSMQTGRNNILAPTIEIIEQFDIEPELLYPIAKSGSVGRYFFEALDKRLIWTEGIELQHYPNLQRYLLPYHDDLASRYDIQNRGAKWWEISSPRNAELFLSESPRILVPFLATGNKFCVDYDRHLNDGGDLRAIFFSDTTLYSPEYICALLNSKLIEFYHLQHTKLKRGGYYEYFENQLAHIPIYRITFTTPADERARLLAEGQALAAAWVQQPDAAATPYPTFLASPFGAWLAARLPASIEHPASSNELPASSTEQPASSNKQPASSTEQPASSNKQPASSTEQPATSNQSDVVHDLLASLAETMLALNREKQAEMRGFLAWLERHIGAKVDALTGKTNILGYLGDYQKGESALAFDDLLKRLRQNRRKLTADPDARAFQETLEREYTASLAKLLPLKQRLAAADRLIDLIVYRLYGLTEEEVEIVEGKE